MIDALIRCADMAEWDAAREVFGLHDGNSHHCRVYALDGETPAYLSYDYVWASGYDLSAIAADPRCMIVASRQLYEACQDFILQTAIPYLDLPLYFVDTVPMGTRYPFG